MKKILIIISSVLFIFDLISISITKASIRGHYVIVRKEQGDKVIVRTITSLESNIGFKTFRINKVK